MVEHDVASQQRTAYVLLTLGFHREGRLWVGVCRELGTAADGRDIEQASASLTKLVELELAGLAQLGELQRVLQQQGIRCYDGEMLDVAMPSLPPLDAIVSEFLQIVRLSLPAECCGTAAGGGG